MGVQEVRIYHVNSINGPLHSAQVLGGLKKVKKL